MINKTIGITPASPGQKATLRVDGIRTLDLVQIGRVLAEGDQGSIRLQNALEHLGKVADNPREGELDAAIADVLSEAGLGDRAEMDLSPADVYQLAEQAGAAVAAMAPVLRPVASRQEAGAA